MKTPVALFIFKRPHTLKQVFETIKRVKPPVLFIIADGPRNKKEKDLCLKTREVVEKIDWKCKVYRNYSNTNLGLRKRISGGLKWIFSKSDRVIVLEEDCIPNETFFRFSEELLDKYENDERIMAVSGNNLQLENNEINYSYYFSYNFHLWGWATWKRAFKHYDDNMSAWPAIKKLEVLDSILKDRWEIARWKRIFDKTYKNKIDTWAYRWVFSCWAQNGLCILPNVNLVTNVGFDRLATHTKFETKFSNIPARNIGFPLKHPSYIIRNNKADEYTHKLFSKTSLLEDYIKSKLWDLLGHSK